MVPAAAIVKAAVNGHLAPRDEYHRHDTRKGENCDNNFKRPLHEIPGKDNGFPDYST
jgi:hypothetical protein